MVKMEDLKRINLLKHVPGHLLEIISREANLKIFGTDTQLITINQRVDTFYMLIMGQVSIAKEFTPDIDVIIEHIQSGSSFGISALLKGETASYTAICQEPCEVITLSGERMIQLFETNHELAYYIMLDVSQRYKRFMDMRARMILKILNKNPELKQNFDYIDTL